MDRNDFDFALESELSRRAFLGRGALGVGALGLVLAGCGSTSSGSSTGSSAAAQTSRALSSGPPTGGTPVKGGTLRLGFITGGPAESISLLDAGLVGTGDFTRAYALFDGLVIPTPGGTVGPALATSWETNSDATLWTFHLRHGVVFHNGKSFGADDVVYTIQHLWNNPKNIYNVALATMIDFAGVRKVDNYTVQVPLKLGIAQFPSTLCLPQAYIGAAGTTNWGDGNGTGPFTLESFHPGVQSVFGPNKNYWQEGLPYVASLVINTSYTTESDRLNALLAGDIDIVPGVDPGLAAANASNGTIVIGNQAGPGFVDLNMRSDTGVFADPRVRKAFHLIADQAPYVTDAFNGYATIGNDCPCNTDQFHASDLVSVHDPEQAKSILKSAGHENLSITLATSPVVPGLVPVATLFKQQAQAAGVNVSLRVYPTSTYLTPATGFFKREFDMEFYTTGCNSLASYYVTSAIKGGIYDMAHWGDASATYGPNNTLLFDALKETNNSLAAEKWHVVQSYDHTQGAWIIPANTNWVDAYAKHVRGVQTTSVLLCGNFNFAGAWLGS
ncbi:MAG TPA: ABC transporter substrate-binding protein [Solirubrobacteraceae bacterium]|nr:ABC transporter substrate-binding protein [Solirubrobacteraceae bacterium]